MLPNVPLIMFTMENPKDKTTEPKLDPNLESTDPDVKTAPESKKPEKPNPQEAPVPKPDVSKCNLSAEGTFDKGVADCKLKKSSSLEIERTQILILVKDGKRYTYTRTDIK